MPDKFAITAGTVVPMNAEPLRDGAVIVSGGKIERVLRRSELSSDIARHDYPAGILMPALVNAHTHLIYSAYTGLADNADMVTWLTQHMIPLGQKLSGTEYLDSARSGIRQCFRNGITAIGEQHYMPWGLRAMEESGMKGVYFYEVFGLRTLDLANSVDDNKKVIEDLVARKSGNIRVGVAPHAPYSVTPPMGRMAAELAEKYQLPISAHVAESHDEAELFVKGDGRFASVRRAVRYDEYLGKQTPLEYFNKLGILAPRTMIVHGIYLSDSDIEIIARNGCSMITCPTSNAKLGVGVARVREWADKGINICIATDSLASGESFDLFEEMRRFVLFQRALTGETDVFTSENVLDMVTVNPAKSLGLSDMVGDMREGSCADLILVSPDEIFKSKFRDIHDRILWEVKSENIECVWADGKEVYRK